MAFGKKENPEEKKKGGRFRAVSSNGAMPLYSVVVDTQTGVNDLVCSYGLQGVHHCNAVFASVILIPAIVLFWQASLRDSTTLKWISFAWLVILSIIEIIYENTGNRFAKGENGGKKWINAKPWGLSREG